MAARAQNLHLVLFFTYGISLKTWDKIGMFEREVALYKALRPHLRGISFITHGDENDLKYKEMLSDICIICNRWRLPNRFYCWLIVNFYPLFWEKATVVKSNQIQGADIALRAAQRREKKIIVRCGYLYSDFMEKKYGKDSPQAYKAHLMEEKVFSEADQVVVTTACIKETILDQYKIRAEKIAVIPNYVLTDLFRPPKERKKRTGINSKRICFVGRLDKQKNIFALIESLRGLKAELIIVGNGPLRNELEKEAYKNSLSVKFLGNMPHRRLPHILNSCDLFILPSFYEGHPKALLEAMACGLPVIGTNVPGIRELITHRETGYLCGTSPEEVREAIKEVMGDQELQEKMARNAREFVVENFSLNKILESELKLLGKMKI